MNLLEKETDDLNDRYAKSKIQNPKSLVRQVRLELTIPCLRGRCLDPIWPLTRVIANCRFPIADWNSSDEQALQRIRLSIPSANQQSQIGNWQCLWRG